MLREILEKPKRENKRETTPIGCNAAIVHLLLKQRVLVRFLLLLGWGSSCTKDTPTNCGLLAISLSLSLSLSLPPKKREKWATPITDKQTYKEEEEEVMSSTLKKKTKNKNKKNIHKHTNIQRRRRRSDELHFAKINK
jgi:hypothetical protein